MPQLDRTLQRVALGLYRLLAEGRPVSVKSLAQRLEVSPEDVSDTLRSWPGVYHNDEGDITGFWGLSLQEMPHRFEIEGKQLYTWCAWDTLFLPELIGRTAEVAVGSHVL